MEKEIIQNLLDEIATLWIIAKDIQNHDYKILIFYKLHEMQTVLENLLSKEVD
jgi:hypothetical protein